MASPAGGLGSVAHHAKRPVVVVPVVALIGAVAWLGYRSGQQPAAASVSMERMCGWA